MTRNLRGEACLLFISCAFAWSGCSLVWGYPDTREESTSVLCENGTDDDFDGTVDCDDPSCDGHCVERDRACTDGRNNDGDRFAGRELVDDFDTDCWGESARISERCRFRAGSFRELRSWSNDAPFPGEDWVTTGVGVPYSTGSLDAAALRLLSGQFVQTVAPTTGASGEFRLNIRMNATPDAQLLLALVSPTTGARTEVWLDHSAEGRRVRVMQGDHTAFEGLDVVGGQNMAIVATGGRWRLQAGSIDEAFTVLSPFETDEALHLRIECAAERVGTSVELVLVTFARESADSCGRTVASPLVNAASLRAVAESDEARCLVLATNAYASRDGRVWSIASRPLPTGDIAMMRVSAFSRFEALRWDAAHRALTALASEDCLAFQSSPAALVSDLMVYDTVRLVGADYIADDESGPHFAYFLAQEDIQRTIVVMRSGTGLPQDYTLHATHAWPFGTWSTATPLSVTRIGGSLIVTGPGEAPGNLALYRLSGDGASVIRDPLIEPSREPGAVDRYRISGGVLTARWRESPDGLSELFARIYYFAHIEARDPEYSSSSLRAGADWIDLAFGAEL